ncbi:MAG TPA: acyl-[acyl-carrier-protein]--UDP-N-acetylglucosamine O-acyltransferase, partial [Candidatus Omnitrophica bacterium]|nr:acyl-[acyl-carrier-protein]--UDP-N-acetylglucosamine O-acyltransferase [Candidatus Omnitrophota bacterium]
MIHKTAIVSDQAQIAGDVTIGPFSVVGPKVRIGHGVTVANNCLIDGNT